MPQPMLRSFFAAAFVAPLLLLTGCEGPAADASGADKSSNPAAPAASESRKPAAEPPAATEDASAAAALLRGSAPQRPSEPAMPPGHPPIGGQESAPPPATGALPAGHPPIGGTGDPPATPPPAGERGTTKLLFDAPSAWTVGAPTNAMRLAQWTLPKAEGDSADGDMVLFFFGVGSGGGVEMNLDRWRGMFKTAGGEPVPDDAVRRETFDVGSQKVHYLEVFGEFENRMAPGAPVLGMKSAHRMLAAVVEGEGGPWFFRGVGPDNTMQSQRDAFLAMLKSVRVEPK